MSERGAATATIGWDVGGAHVKAARVQRGEVVDAAQWPCPLWQGMQHLDAALAPGTFVDARIVSAHPHHLLGERVAAREPVPAA